MSDDAIPTLFPFQAEKVDEVFALIEAGQRRILVVSPTGSGKTVMAAEIIRRLNIARQEVLFLDHLREITTQTSAKLNRFGVFNGIIQAGIRATPLAGVQIASTQTIGSRAFTRQGERSARMELPPARVIFIDEAHHSVAQSYQKILEQYPDAIVIGLTATPCRRDGRGLGGVFKVMVVCPDVPDLIAMGRLVPSRVYAPAPPNLSGIRTQGGDYAQDQLAERMDKKKLIADIVTTWFQHGEDRQSVYYATSVGHSLHIRDEFRNAGVTCEHVDGKTPIEEREDILGRFAAKQVRVLSNCAVFTEGWDVPDIGCVGIARPTKSFGLLWQMIGRGRRTAPGKKDVIILDHGGHFPEKFGMPDDRLNWTLSPDRRAAVNVDDEQRKASKVTIAECPKCGTLREGGKPCSHCGYLPAPKKQVYVPADGELVAVTGKREQAPERPVDHLAVMKTWYAMLLGYAQEQGKKPGMAYYKFKEKFHCDPPWPRRDNPQPMTPSKEVRAWVTSRNIAWAYGQRGGGHEKSPTNA